MECPHLHLVFLSHSRTLLFPRSLGFKTFWFMTLLTSFSWGFCGIQIISTRLLCFQCSVGLYPWEVAALWKLSHNATCHILCGSSRPHYFLQLSIVLACLWHRVPSSCFGSSFMGFWYPHSCPKVFVTGCLVSSVADLWPTAYLMAPPKMNLCSLLYILNFYFNQWTAGAIA